MEFAKKTDKVFTIIYTIISILSIIILITASIYPGRFINNILGLFSSNSYQTYNTNTLLNLMGHAYIGSFSVIILYILSIFAVICGLPLTVITIFSYIRMIVYRKTQNQSTSDATWLSKSYTQAYGLFCRS